MITPETISLAASEIASAPPSSVITQRNSRPFSAASATKLSVSERAPFRPVSTQLPLSRVCHRYFNPSPLALTANLASAFRDAVRSRGCSRMPSSLSTVSRAGSEVALLPEASVIAQRYCRPFSSATASKLRRAVEAPARLVSCQSPSSSVCQLYFRPSPTASTANSTVSFSRDSRSSGWVRMCTRPVRYSPAGSEAALSPFSSVTTQRNRCPSSASTASKCSVSVSLPPRPVRTQWSLSQVCHS